MASALHVARARIYINNRTKCLVQPGTIKEMEKSIASHYTAALMAHIYMITCILLTKPPVHV